MVFHRKERYFNLVGVAITHAHNSRNVSQVLHKHTHTHTLTHFLSHTHTDTDAESKPESLAAPEPEMSGLSSLS
jgi:hypothetical protein